MMELNLKVAQEQAQKEVGVLTPELVTGAEAELAAMHQGERESEYDFPVETLEKESSEASECVCPEENAADESRERKLTEEPDVSALLVEAEERGYLRGLNERAERLMRRPSLGFTK
ncbi:MAG: hypothetical protein ACI4SO_02170 [Muribaculaceae bacterium]